MKNPRWINWAFFRRAEQFLCHSDWNRLQAPVWCSTAYPKCKCSIIVRRKNQIRIYGIAQIEWSRSEKNVNIEEVEKQEKKSIFTTLARREIVSLCASGETSKIWMQRDRQCKKHKITKQNKLVRKKVEGIREKSDKDKAILSSTPRELMRQKFCY